MPKLATTRRAQSLAITVTRISVILPTLNEADTIQAAVKSAWAAGADEVIVADGGSSDSTITLAIRLKATVIETEIGRGSQLAAGCQAASGEILVMLHADSELANDAFDELKRVNSNLFWGCFTQKIQNQRKWYRIIEWGNTLRVQVGGMVYGDQAFWVRRTALNSIGGIPELPLMEDVALSRLLRRSQRPHILSAVTTTSARRWEEEGILRRTAKNWGLLFRYLVLRTPARILADEYKPKKS